MGVKGRKKVTRLFINTAAFSEICLDRTAGSKGPSESMQRPEPTYSSHSAVVKPPVIEDDSALLGLRLPNLKSQTNCFPVDYIAFAKLAAERLEGCKI
jgi:hypothetical protein